MTGDERQPPPAPEQIVTVVFHKPFCRPGTPEAHRHGCLCGFESNLHVAMVAADRDDGMDLMSIHKDCPMHETRSGPIDPYTE